MALNDILTSMDGARDALVTAINNKGGSLSDSATLYQCADAVGSLSGGTSAEYYKCTSVNTSAAAPQGSTLTMHQGSAQWVFHLQDASAAGDDRVWISQAQQNYTGMLLYLNKTYQIGSEYSWAIRDESNNIHYYAQSVTDQPWDNATMFDNNIMISSVSVTWDVSQAVADSKTWSGYKAVFDSTAGTWSFESDSTEGLTYTSVKPIVGSIYSADALVTVASVYIGYYPTSAPVNPASATDGDWIISASSNLDSRRNCIYAFHETIGHDNYCWHSSSGMPQWIQWQNTAQKVLVKSYILTQRSSAGSYSSTWTLSGSNNGETWDELDSVSLDSVVASQVTTRNLTSNNTPYYYHRITVTKCDITGTNYATIGRIQAFNYLQE